MDFISPGHLESKLLISKQPGDQRLYVLFEGLGNEDKMPCPRALLPLPADSNRRPHGWESVVLSTEPLYLQSDVALCDAVVFTILRNLSLSSAALTASCSVIPVELLMSLSHDVGGRPLLLFPLTFPVMIVLSVSPFLRITCPKKRHLISPSYNLSQHKPISNLV